MQREPVIPAYKQRRQARTAALKQQKARQVFFEFSWRAKAAAVQEVLALLQRNRT